jgi:hypothetical protein
VGYYGIALPEPKCVHPPLKAPQDDCREDAQAYARECQGLGQSQEAIDREVQERDEPLVPEIQDEIAVPSRKLEGRLEHKSQEAEE